MKYLFYSILFFSLILSIITGCSDDPNILGIGLISSQDTLKTFSTSAEVTTDSTFFYTVIGTSGSIVGFNHDALSNTSQESRGLIQFQGFTVLSETTQVISAIVKIPVDYKFKNSTGKIKLNVHEILVSWNEKALTWNHCTPDSFYKRVPDTTFSANIDTSTKVLMVDITPVVSRWVKEQTDVPYGILLIPDTLLSDIIVGTRNSFDTLKVEYRSAGTTASFSVISTQQSFIANGAVPKSDSIRYIQGGIGYRELIRFDISSLPKHAGISQATFEVTSDENSAIKNGYTRDSLVAFLVLDTTFASLSLGTICSKSTDGSRTIYSADIRAIVQKWVVRQENYGIVLRSYSEGSSFDRFAVFGKSSQDPSRRPKLKIKYTVLP